MLTPTDAQALIQNIQSLQPNVDVEITPPFTLPEPDPALVEAFQIAMNQGAQGAELVSVAEVQTQQTRLQPVEEIEVASASVLEQAMTKMDTLSHTDLMRIQVEVMAMQVEQTRTAKISQTISQSIDNLAKQNG